MSIVAKQLHRPFQTPFERNLSPVPDAVFGTRPVTNGGLSFRLGRIRFEVPGVLGVVIDRSVDYSRTLSKFRNAQGIINGGTQSVGAGLPVFFNRPDDIEVVDVAVLPNRVCRISYEDFAGKHPDLRSPYELTVLVEYIETSPELESLEPEIRRRIYEDLALSGYFLLEVDPDKYRADANYSAAQETAKRLNQESYVGGHNYIEPQIKYPQPPQPPAQPERLP